MALARPFDLIVIGGGITGAGILREATRLGLRAVLFEAQDFASGTSSRSSKLVHGGLRYLKNAQIRLTYESVRERERLLHEGRGLVTPLTCLIANFEGDHPPAWVFGAGLMVYDLLAMQWSHQHYSARRFRGLCPPLSPKGLLGGYRYWDAQTDDARLVLRVIREAERNGALALNYVRAEELLYNRKGMVCGVVVHDQTPEGRGRKQEVSASVVINATGVWADSLRVQALRGRTVDFKRLRPLRGSHLLFPASRLPINRALNFLHPKDDRPVFAVPWEGVTLFGTTDVDHPYTLDVEPAISGLEIEYLLEGLRYAFPAQELALDDVFATLAGVRPVVDTGNPDPSKESREHVLWEEKGLLTVSGGKLTTFRLMAREALKHVRGRLPHPMKFNSRLRLLEAPPERIEIIDAEPEWRWRLAGRYGYEVFGLLKAAHPGEMTPILDSMALWAELRWAARVESVVHLDDLLLRRVRVGLMLPRGGVPLLPQIRTIVQPELNWDDERWEAEAARYAKLWEAHYSPRAGG